MTNDETKKYDCKLYVASRRSVDSNTDAHGVSYQGSSL